MCTRTSGPAGCPWSTVWPAGPCAMGTRTRAGCGQGWLAHSTCAPTQTWWGALLTWRNALIMIVVYLVIASTKDLAPVASRVIRWASALNGPVLSAVVTVCLAWTRRGQAQQLWASTHALIHRHALCPHPATCSWGGNYSRQKAPAIAQIPGNLPWHTSATCIPTKLPIHKSS